MHKKGQQDAALHYFCLAGAQYSNNENDMLDGKASGPSCSANGICHKQSVFVIVNIYSDIDYYVLKYTDAYSIASWIGVEK